MTLMMETFTAPDITWPELSGEAHHEDGDAEHSSYTPETLKVAITQGFNPAGDALGNRMPRWEMSPGDLDDLVAFLMALGQDDEE